MLAMALTASAERHYYWELYQLNDSAGNNSRTHYSIEFDNNIFMYDSDSEDDATFQIKNLKTSGNKKTFELYRSDVKGTTKVVMYTDDKNRTILKVGSRTEYVVTDDTKVRDNYDRARRGEKSKKSSPQETIKDKATNKAKGLLNKGKSLIKK